MDEKKIEEFVRDIVYDETARVIHIPSKLYTYLEKEKKGNPEDQVLKIVNKYLSTINRVHRE